LIIYETKSWEQDRFQYTFIRAACTYNTP